MIDQPATTSAVPEPGADGSEARGGRRRAFREAHARLRVRLDSRPRLRLLYKVGVGVLGGLIVVIGLILVPLPGPGWLVVFVGVAVLGTEFPAAHRITLWVRGVVRRVRLRWRAWRVSRAARRASASRPTTSPSR